MSDLKINTEQVVVAANRIKALNDQMRDGLDGVQEAIKKLDNSWDGSAASYALVRFHQMIHTHCNPRYDILDNYVAFLYQQVGEGYTQSETANISLADQFK